MALSTGIYLKKTFDAVNAMGDKFVSSDGQFVIDGFEEYGLLIKQFPWPVMSSGEAIEIPSMMGAKYHQRSQHKVNQQGSIGLMETQAGHIGMLMRELINKGGYFDAKVYKGEKENYTTYHRIERCTIQLEPGEVDWENSTQIMTLQGTLFYHYFGEQSCSGISYPADPTGLCPQTEYPSQ